MKKITLLDYGKNRTKKTKRWLGWLTFCVMLFGQLGFAQTVQIGSGTDNTGATDNTVPITNYHFSYCQIIVTESQITGDGGSAGEISKLRFYTTSIGTPSVWAGNWSVYLGNTAKTEFTSNTDWVALADLEEVYVGSVTPVANNWWEINFTTPFNYTGGNLVVAIDENTPGWIGVPTFRTFGSGSNTGLYYRTDNVVNNPDPATPPLVATGGALGRTATLPQMQLYFTEACAYPEALTAVNITQNSADLGWSSDGDLFDVEWGTTGFTPTGEPNGANETGITSNSLTLNGLSASTSYQFYVRQNCGAIDGLSSWSGPHTFITACNLPDTPTEITFSSITATGTTVNYVAPSVAPTGYVIFRSTSSVPPVLTNGTTYTTNNTTAIASLTSGSNTYFCVYNGTASSGAITGLTSNTQYYYHVFSRSSENSCSGAPWYSTSALSGSQATAPAAPTTPVVSDITTDEATISWTASVVGGEAGVISYIIEVYTDNGYTTAITGSPFNVGTVLTYDFTDLDHSTQYYYRIKANNTFADSSYLTGNFTTLCAPEVAPTTIQTFSSYTGTAPATLPCWSEATGTLDTALTGTTSTWQNQAYNLNYPAGTTTNGTAAYINLHGTDNEWLISNSIDLGDGTTAFQLEYDVSITPWTGIANVTTMGEKFVKVVVSTDNGATWTTANIIKTYDNNDIPGNGGRSEIIALTGYSGIIKIGFYAHSTATTNDTRFYIDNFKIDEIPDCPLPTLVNVSATTYNSTTIGWTSDGSLFDIEIIGEGVTPTGTPTYSGVTNPFTTTAPLIPATSYDVYVRQNCGVDGTSTWVGPLTFTTECLPPSITGTTPGEVCGQGEVELSATADAGATISWYSDETGGTKLAEGAMFTTPLITETTSYWVEAFTGTQGVGGKLVPNAGASTSSVNNWGINFTLTEEATFNSVDVYSTNAGTLDIKITDNNGVELYSTGTVSVVNGGSTTPNVIPLSFTANPGNYRMLIKSYNANIIRDNSNVSFPYNSNDGVLTVNSSEWGGPTSDYYYYFYNIVYSAGCSSERTEVVATVTDAPALTLNQTSLDICEGETQTVTFTSNSDDYTSYVWEPSIGVTGDEIAGWTFSPTETTTYTLTASQSSSPECVSIIEMVVNVNPIIEINNIEEEICANEILELNSGVSSEPTVIGAGVLTSTATSTGIDLGPNPLQTYYGNTKQQWIYTTDELLSNGFLPGTAINSFTIELSQATAIAFNNLIVKMKNSSTTTFATTSSWESGMTVVKAASTHTSVTALNTFTLDTPFIWDGSNLVIEINYRNNNSGTTPNTAAKYDNTSFNSTIFYRTDGTTTDVNNFTGTASYIMTRRNNVSFDVTLPIQSITWSPTTNLFIDEDATQPYIAETHANAVYFKTDTSGVNNYIITVTTIAECESTATVDVIVNEAPELPSGNALQDIMLEETIADLAITGTNLTWYSDSALTTEVENTLEFNVAGTFTYYVTNTVGDCTSASVEITVTVIDPCADTALPSGNASQDAFLGDTIADLDITGTDLTWYSDSALTTEVESTLEFNETGIFVYYVTNTVEDCTSTSIEITVTVIDPCADTALPSGNASQDAFLGNTIADLDITGTDLTWYSDSALTTEVESTLEFNETGTFVYYVTNIVGDCTSASIEITVTVIDPCVDTALPSGNASQDTFLGDTIADLDITGTDLTWYSDSALTTEVESTLEFNETGTFVYYVTNTVGDCTSVSVEITIVVTDPCDGVTPPQAESPQTLTQNQTVSDIVVTDVTGTLTWYSDENLENEVENTFVLTESSYTFYVTQTVDGCVSEATEVVVQVTLSTGKFDDASFRAYPNPIKDFYNISYSKEISNVSVVNMLGQTIIENVVNSTNTQIDMSTLPTGSYFVKVTSEGAVKTVKVIKQ